MFSCTGSNNDWQWNYSWLPRPCALRQRKLAFSGWMPSAHKSIDTEPNTTETWGFDLCFLKCFVLR
jgi:hypothetical protein